MGIKWYSYSQNNSGGSFIENENICEWMLIEANTADEANQIMTDIVDSNDAWDYCPCCGERWDINMDESDGHDVPSIWEEPISEVLADSFRSRAILYYLDGKKEEYIFKAKD